MFDKFKEEKGGEMMEERIEENVNEEESVEESWRNYLGRGTMEKEARSGKDLKGIWRPGSSSVV